MIIVLYSITTASKTAAASVIQGPTKRTDPDHHPEDDVHHPHMLLHCNGAVFPDLDQSPLILPGPFHQSLLLPSSQAEVFPAELFRREKAILRKVYLKFND